MTAAEAAKLDFMFYGEDLSVAETGGKVIEPYSAGRLDSLTLYCALAAITSKIGLMATVNATFCDPYELSRQIASLEAISGGRAGWNMVTSAGASTSENFSVGAHVPRDQRYQWAAEFVELTAKLWATPTNGVKFHGRYFNVTTTAGLPVDPQVRPVMMQSGESDAGRDFASAHADLVFTGFESVEKGQGYYRDVKRRIAARGRAPDGVRIMGSAFVHVGETDADAVEEFAEIRKSMMTPGMVRNYLGRFLGRDLSGYDIEAPCPISNLTGRSPVSTPPTAFAASVIRAKRSPNSRRSRNVRTCHGRVGAARVRRHDGHHCRFAHHCCRRHRGRRGPSRGGWVCSHVLTAASRHGPFLRAGAADLA